MGTVELLSGKHGEYVKGGRQRALEEQQMEVHLPPLQTNVYSSSWGN